MNDRGAGYGNRGAAGLTRCSDGATWRPKGFKRVPPGWHSKSLARRLERQDGVCLGGVQPRLTPLPCANCTTRQPVEASHARPSLELILIPKQCTTSAAFSTHDHQGRRQCNATHIHSDSDVRVENNSAYLV